MNSYLVTGGAGFIGSHVVDALVARGDSVRVVDDLSTGKRENIARHTNVELIEEDLSNPGVAMRAVTGVSHVIHIAAIPSVPRSVEQPVKTHRANVEGTLLLLLAARDAKIKRLVFASSSSVYGDAPALPKHEEMSPNPLSPYALQKLIGEEYMRLFYRLYGLDTVALRFFNVFGPRQDPSSNYSGVISIFTAALSEGRVPIIHGDGQQTRDFTYVSDVADGVLAATCAQNVAGKVFNLGRGDRMSLTRLFEVLRELVGSKIEPRYGELRKGDVRDSQADISRARQFLGFNPSITVEEGLRRTVQWYLASIKRSTSS